MATIRLEDNEMEPRVSVGIKMFGSSSIFGDRLEENRGGFAKEIGMGRSPGLELGEITLYRCLKSQGRAIARSIGGGNRGEERRRFLSVLTRF
ncbi:MAG: hypothetical protein D6680_01265 [Cyanobacteria bacterium J007]|nr:MAG: hypothetical protein D6680_01265 [Cyanobacteria bacterium J007]